MAAALMLAPAMGIAVRRGWGDFRLRNARSLGEMEAACRVDPGRVDCAAALARGREEQALAADAEWGRVLELSPRNASYLTQAALAAEFRGDTARAEALLQQAARHNRLWLPRWSLANFYYRHERMGEFRRWARLAFERAYGDRTALLRLCRAAGVSGAELREELIGAGAENAGALVSFLVEEGPAAELPAAAHRYLDALKGAPRRETVPVMTHAINAMWREGQVEAAPAVWSRMAREGVIDRAEWSESTPLMNADFQPPLPGGGLDWQIPRHPGVEAFPGVPPGGIKFTFSGGQPEVAELLVQSLVLRGGSVWTLEFEYQTPGVGKAASSLAWELGGWPAEGEAGRLASEEWTVGRVSWEVPAGLHPASLALVSRRPLGHARHEGELRLRNLRLSPASGGGR